MMWIMITGFDPRRRQDWSHALRAMGHEVAICPVEEDARVMVGTHPRTQGLERTPQFSVAVVELLVGEVVSPTQQKIERGFDLAIHLLNETHIGAVILVTRDEVPHTETFRQWVSSGIPLHVNGKPLLVVYAPQGIKDESWPDILEKVAPPN